MTGTWPSIALVDSLADSNCTPALSVEAYKGHEVGLKFGWPFVVINAHTASQLKDFLGLTVSCFCVLMRGASTHTATPLKWIVACVYGLADVIDSIISGTLILYLLRSRTGFKP